MQGFFILGLRDVQIKRVANLRYQSWPIMKLDKLIMSLVTSFICETLLQSDFI